MSGEEGVNGGPVFKALSAEEDDMQPTIIESLCMNCYKDGSTRLLLTRIPFFKEIIISSFTCPHCNWSNTEIQSAGRIQEQGIQYALKVKAKMDMNREVVKSDSATTRIPELDFEIPAFTQKGSLSTIEGLIDRAVAGLEQDQVVRRATNPDVAVKIDEFVDKLKELKNVESEFTLVIDDPSGNSFIENLCAPNNDPDLTVTRYKRTDQQNAVLGIQENDVLEENPGNDLESLRNEVLVFNTNCPECNAPAHTNMKLVQIPHFKEVVIMATNCDSCGHRTNEVKSGGATEEQGTRLTLHMTNPLDMTRDLLKSETCSVLIPELEFELGMGALAGKFTTVEGLLKDIKELILKNPFSCGDSSVSEHSEKLKSFAETIDKIVAGKEDAHLVLDDPSGNSYIQNLHAPEPDPDMKTEKYTRSFEQNEELGLNDMKTEGYEA